MFLNNEQIKRYSRQMILPEFSATEQEKLLSSRVLVLGAGGLGSGVLYYLSAAGVGHIGVVDFDKVDLSNLHRQIIHFTEDINKPKVLSVKEKKNKLNPEINVITFEEKININNIEKIIDDFEIIVDCLDSFNDKFLVNEVCVKKNKKLIHAGALGFEGQILTIIPPHSACLRCYFPDKQPEDLRQSCSEAGILNTCVGVISVLRANEVIKLITGIGSVLTNRVLKFNAKDSRFYELEINGKNKNCPICSHVYAHVNNSYYF